MKLGAYDYLRKLNLSSDELENILEKCLVETEERITVHMQGIREIRYEEIVRDSRDILAGACNYQTLICILAKDTEELSRVTEIIHKWAETELREGLQIQKGNQYGYFLLEEKPEKSVYMELKKRAERKTDRELYMGIFEGCMEKTADIVRAAAMAEQIQLFSYYDKEEKLVFFQKKIETEGHSPRGMHGYLDSLKEKIRSFDREKTEQGLHGIFGLIRQESYISINVLRRNFMDILGIYSMVAQSLNGALEEIELDGDNCHYQKIMMMESLREIEKWFLKFNDIFMEKFWIAYKCSRSEILQKVVKYIEAHITEPIHLSDAAAETGVSSAYLSTMFKKEIGYNFIEYVNLRKIELARQMLQDGKMVYEVSELLGFENSTYFSRVFKRYTDVSPDTYRKQM
jgi:two-component system response regulator YesN